MKTTPAIAIATLSALLLLSSVVPVLAVTPDAALAKLGKFPWHSASDNFGNTYSFQKTGSAPRHGVGQITSSPYLADIPWSLTWSQKGNNWHLVATDPVPSNGFCSYEFF